MIKLWSHQMKGVEAARIHRNLALFYDVGTGKTGTMITILREQYMKLGNIIPTLIFAPVSVCSQWKKEFSRFSNIPEDRILVLQGCGGKRTEALLKMMATGKPHIVITNYEAVQIKSLYSALVKWSPNILVCDEAHKLKDSTTVRSKKIYPLARSADRRFLLTGTPILNSMMDLFGQFKILDSSIFGDNAFKFQRIYFYDKNASMPSHVHFPDWQPRPNTAGVLGLTVDAHSVKAKKEECIDLPPLLEPVIKVDLSPKQRKLYESMERNFIASLDETTTVAEFSMTKTMRLQQITAGFMVPDVSTDPIMEIDDNPRIKALEELLDSMPNEKIIIWTVFKHTYKMLEKVCKKLGYSHLFLTGEQSTKQKDEAVESFCRGDTQVLIANPAAGGAGINLTESKVSIYFTTGYSLEHYIQSQGRNYRGGSNMHDKVTHYHFMAIDTLDEVISGALMGKKNVAESVLSWAINVDKNNVKVHDEGQKEGTAKWQ